MGTTRDTTKVLEVFKEEKEKVQASLQGLSAKVEEGVLKGIKENVEALMDALEDKIIYDTIVMLGKNMDLSDRERAAITNILKRQEKLEDDFILEKSKKTQYRNM